LQPTATLIEFRENTEAGRVAVLLDLEDPAIKQHVLPSGLYGQSTIYTEYAHYVAVIPHILLRMSSWLNYMFPFH
jgi:hypothetical protein